MFRAGSSNSRYQLRLSHTGRKYQAFDKFYRVEWSRNVKTGGTGLGLNIAQEIVHLHGGRIQVTSGASGTCFTIALPLHKEEEEE